MIQPAAPSVTSSAALAAGVATGNDGEAAISADFAALLSFTLTSPEPAAEAAISTEAAQLRASSLQIRRLAGNLTGNPLPELLPDQPSDAAAADKPQDDGPLDPALPVSDTGEAQAALSALVIPIPSALQANGSQAATTTETLARMQSRAAGIVGIESPLVAVRPGKGTSPATDVKAADSPDAVSPKDDGSSPAKSSATGANLGPTRRVLPTVAAAHQVPVAAGASAGAIVEPAALATVRGQVEPVSKSTPAGSTAPMAAAPSDQASASPARPTPTLVVQPHRTEAAAELRLPSPPIGTAGTVPPIAMDGVPNSADLPAKPEKPQAPAPDVGQQPAFGAASKGEASEPPISLHAGEQMTQSGAYEVALKAPGSDPNASGPRRPAPGPALNEATASAASVPTQAAGAASDPATAEARVAIAADLQPAPAIYDSQQLAQTAAPVTTAPSAAAAMQPTAHDFARLVDRLVEARETSSSVPQTVSASIAHSEFGQVSLRFDHDASGGLSVAMTSSDPDFAQAVQASAASADARSSTDDRGNQSRHEAASQQGATSSSGQPQSQTSGRNEGARPDGRVERRADLPRTRLSHSDAPSGTDDGIYA